AKREAEAQRQAEAERRIELERQAETKREAEAQRQAEAERQAEADRKSKPAERTGEVQRIVPEYGGIAPARSTQSGDREPGKLKQDGKRPQPANTAPADLRLKIAFDRRREIRSATLIPDRRNGMP